METKKESWEEMLEKRDNKIDSFDGRYVILHSKVRKIVERAKEQEREKIEIKLKEIHKHIMKIDAIGGTLRIDASRLIPIQVNNYGKDIVGFCNEIRTLEDLLEGEKKE